MKHSVRIADIPAGSRSCAFFSGCLCANVQGFSHTVSKHSITDATASEYFIYMFKEVFVIHDGVKISSGKVLERFGILK